MISYDIPQDIPIKVTTVSSSLCFISGRLLLPLRAWRRPRCHSPHRRSERAELGSDKPRERLGKR